MKSEVFFGHHCPNCQTTVGVSAIVGGEGRCPGCGGPLASSEGGPAVTNIANFVCDGCGARVGMLTVVGGAAQCPGCRKNIPV